MGNSWKKQITIYLMGQTLSSFGSSLVQFAITWHIVLLTQSGFMLTLSAVFGFLPRVLISLPAGVWADRFNKKLLITIADGALVITAAILAFLFMAGHEYIWLLFIISAVRSLGIGIREPVVVSIIPSIVPKESLDRINGFQASIQGIAKLAAPVLAGSLYVTIGIHALFFGDVISGALGILSLFFIFIPQLETTKNPSMWGLIVEGVRHIYSTHWLRLFMTIYIFFSLMFGPVIFLTPLLVIRTFGDVAWYLAIREAFLAFGMVIGGLLAGIIAAMFSNKIKLTFFLFGIFGFTTFLLGLANVFWLFAGIVLLLGITMSLVNSAAITVLQTHIAPNYLGRVFSFVSIIGGLTMPVSMVIFGSLSDAVAIEWLLIVSGCVMVMVALFSLRFKVWQMFN